MEDTLVTLLRHVLRELGEDPARDGLLDTPSRVARSLREMTAGSKINAADLLGRQFENASYDQMVVLTGIDFTSTCEHHLLPFRGTATVGYLPATGRVVGISKLARLVDAFAHRLQIQERLTQQIAEAIEEHLSPLGVGVIVSAHHECMSCRGVRKAGTTMITSCLKGVIREDPSAKAELIALHVGARKE